MQVGMVQQVLTPTVQHGEEADLGAEVFGIGGNGAQGFGGGAEENAVDHFLVLVRDGGNLFRQREDDMEVLGVEELGVAMFDPLRPRERLAFRAVAISTGVVRDALCALIARAPGGPPRAAVRHA